MSKQDYDEQAVLRSYLWAQFPIICTEAEQEIYKANLGRLKAANAPSQDRMLRKMFGDWSDPHISSALQDGFDSFTDRVLQRIDRECPELFYVNRCRECGRIVATPKACVCGWCGHEWFSKRDEQNRIAEEAFRLVEEMRRENSDEVTMECEAAKI